MERGSNPLPSDNHHVVIDVAGSRDESLPNSSHHHNVRGSSREQNAGQSSSNDRDTNDEPATSSSNAGSYSRNSSLHQRASGRARTRSPLNSGLWISVELVITLSQVIAAIVVLSLSRNEHPHMPLFLWVVGYASGCVAILPLLYWRYSNHNQGIERDSTQSNENVLSPRALQGDVNTNDIDLHNTTSVSIPAASRLKLLVEYYKMSLDCFFAVWFVVGCVWIFGGHSSASEAPNLYRICIVFLTFSGIGYAMPFILCATICCCLPCIISVVGFREDPPQNRGATIESINALPTYKFIVKKTTGSDEEMVEGVIVAAGTEERTLSGEDAVCCICLGRYANNDELREFPCSHYFHKDCVDTWLKINASCPLCKAEVGQPIVQALREANANVRP